MEDHDEQRTGNAADGTRHPRHGPPGYAKKMVDGQSALLAERRAAAYLDVAPRTLRKMVAAGDAPPPIRLGGRMVRWRRSDLDAAIDRWAAGVPDIARRE